MELKKNMTADAADGRKAGNFAGAAVGEAVGEARNNWHMYSLHLASMKCELVELVAWQEPL